MRILKSASNAIVHLREHGFAETVRYAYERMVEAYYERRLGITTVGKFRPEALGIDSPFSAPYYASDYRTIFRAFGHVAIEPGRDVFVDFGCGMGRALAVAGTYPFRRVIGVELSPQLSGIARDNLARGRLRAGCEAQVITADATRFPIPADSSVIFFYNPFHGPVLEQVLDALRLSLESHPRKMQIVFKNTTHLEPLLPRHPWLVKRVEFPACDGDHQVMILDAVG